MSKTIKCLVCSTMLNEPEPSHDTSPVKCKCGSNYGYANGFRTFFPSKPQIGILRAALLCSPESPAVKRLVEAARAMLPLACCTCQKSPQGCIILSATCPFCEVRAALAAFPEAVYEMPANNREMT